jgi:hypothetical protein
MDLRRSSSGCGESGAAPAEPSLTVRQQIFRRDAAQQAQALVCSTLRITGVKREKSGETHVIALAGNSRSASGASSSSSNTASYKCRNTT